MIPQSVRWRLPISYGAIALLATLALGLVLLTTLRGHYRQQELDHLTNNAQAMGVTITRLFELDAPTTLLQPQLRSFAFLSQARVRLLDKDSHIVADSGAPQEQQATLILGAEPLDIQNAGERPEAPADVGGLFLRREGNSLFIGTGNLSGVKVSGDQGGSSQWDFYYDGPVVEVVATYETQIYRDDTLQQLGGIPPSGPVQQILKPGSLDEIGKNSTIQVWGERRDDHVVAEVIVFSLEANDSGALPEDAWTKVYTSTVPSVEFIIEPTTREIKAASSEDQFVSSDYVYSTYAAGTPYGFGLNAEAPSGEHRSDQVIRQPFYDQGGQLLGYVELSDGPAYGRKILESVARGWVIASGVAVLLSAVVGWMVSRRLTTPLLVLTDVTARMAGGNLSARASVNRQDELGLLARSFNEMAGRVEETVVALRRFVADAAHELHTPLTALRTNLELVTDEPDSARQQEFMRRAEAQVKRLETLTQSLLDLSRIEAGTAEEKRAGFDLVGLMQETSELYASRAEQADISFSLDLPGEVVMIQGNRAQLRQALGNLLDNALKFTPAGGEISVGLRQEDTETTLWVQDTGIGVPADDLSDLFNRFHRGRNATAYPGSGLGLAIVQAIVEGHKGQVTAESTGQGSRFVMRLPNSGINPER